MATKGFGVEKPWLPEHYELATEDTKVLLEGHDAEERIQGILFRNLVVEEADLSGLCLSRVKMERCTFIDCNFEKAELGNVLFQSCNF